jgi:fructuronate reductase
VAGLVGTHRHPTRMIHLGLGAFHRAHQAWYTQVANDGGDDWGIAAFTGRSPDAAVALAAQDGVYTLIERAVSGDRAREIESIVAAVDGADADAWLAAFADPSVGVVTLTVTEAGYDPESGVGDRLRAGLRARADAGAGPIAIVSCDNLPANGEVSRRIVRGNEQADELDAWIDENVGFVSTMVDRITPATTDDDRAIAQSLVGWTDAVPVVTEPFSEWVLSGAFPAGRPAWEAGGARFVDDVEPYEQRKLWLLNAGHSLLAYHGLRRGLETVAEAVADPFCAAELERLWSEARVVVPLPDGEIDEALESLRTRFANPRIRHRLAQIAEGGALKLPVRVLEVVRRRRAAGLGPGAALAGVVAAYALFAQPGANPTRAASIIEKLAPDLADDPELRSLVADRLAEFVHHPQGAR